MNDANPYASPKIVADLAAAEDQPRELKIASQGKRFLNLILDNVVLFLLGQAVGLLLGFAYGTWLMATKGSITKEDETQFQIFSMFVGIFLAVVYYIVTEGLLQRTLAKYLTGTMVVNVAGGRPTFGQIVGRAFTRLVPFEAFTFLGGERPVGLHDRWSGTRVIDLRK